MTTSLTKSSISAIPNDGKPTQDQYVFFARRLKNKLHGEVLRCYLREKKENNLTKAELARRMDKDPAQINRWLAAPKNLELDTISELLLAMGYIPTVGSEKLSALFRANYFESDDQVSYTASSTPVSAGKFTQSGSRTSNTAVFEAAGV